MTNSIDTQEAFTFKALQWDTDFFGVACAKAFLHQPLTLEKWNELADQFCDYKFIAIENTNADPTNAQLIGKNSTAFLADVNIQFIKKCNRSISKPESIEIVEKMEKNEQILKISEFQFSKFLEDPELLKRSGSEVYHQWLCNSFGKEGKFYALSKNEQDEINGYVLFSYSGNACVIELIHVAKSTAHGGIGSRLFQAVEYAACEHGCYEIRVGTQIRNQNAINFYHKVGCKQVGCHQIYHLWR